MGARDGYAILREVQRLVVSLTARALVRGLLGLCLGLVLDQARGQSSAQAQAPRSRGALSSLGVPQRAPRILNQAERALPPSIQRLLLAYPEQLITASMEPKSAQRVTPRAPRDVALIDEWRSGELIWRNGPPMRWRASTHEVSLDEWARASQVERTRWLGGRPYQRALESPELGDQLLQRYPKGQALPRSLPLNFEPGRIRYEPFFKRMYGASRSDVGAHLTLLRWGDKRLRVTRVNGIDQKLKQVYRELRSLPRKVRPFYQESAGAFVWRKIKGTSRISVHSFGAAIDLGVKYSNYWRWTLKVLGEDEDGLIPYQNRFPEEVIRIFERHGWIWGGWWYHHDTMHFEYRPELLVEIPDHQED